MSSIDLKPGTKLRHNNGGKIVTLECRKEPGDERSTPDMPFWPGWWLGPSEGGIGDFVIDAPDSRWEVLE